MTDEPIIPPHDADPIIAAVQRMIDESRAIDTKRALEGIKANRTIRRNHNHSVRHKSYR